MYKGYTRVFSDVSIASSSYASSMTTGKFNYIAYHVISNRFCLFSRDISNFYHLSSDISLISSRKNGFLRSAYFD